MADDGPNPFTLANERMTIIEACNELGMEILGHAGNMKFYCPFGDIYHMDGGRSKAFRVYEHTNSAYCFACQKAFTPVGLIAMDRDLTYREAAEWILEKTNYIPPDYELRWDAITAPVKEKADADGLAEALKLACRRMDPAFETRQFDERVAHKLQQCLGLLRKIETDEQAREWLAVSKLAMQKVLSR